jgi:hypothetical protein
MLFRLLPLSVLRCQAPLHYQLSTYPSAHDEYCASDLAVEFAKTAAKAKKLGIKRIKSDLYTHEINICESCTLHDWLFDSRFAGEVRPYREFLESMITHPYIEENDVGTEEYLSSNFYFEDAENGIGKINCKGLAIAYVQDTFSVSFNNGAAWAKTDLGIAVESEDGKTRHENVRNIYSCACFEREEIIRLISNKIGVAPAKTPISAGGKKFHLTHHHGQQELKLLWEKIKYNPYVESAISAEWGGNSFIRKCNGDGSIEIVLTQTQNRYALSVKTTGCNIVETEYIAGILAKEFDN